MEENCYNCGNCVSKGMRVLCSKKNMTPVTGEKCAMWVKLRTAGVSER